MIDVEILDEVLPAPDEEELKNAKVDELKADGFVISNFNSGGVFYTLLMLFVRLKIEFTELLRAVLSNMTLTHGVGTWLDLKAGDFSRVRKLAQKTQGKLTLTRSADYIDAVTIPKGHVFKSQKDLNGDELRFVALETTILQKGTATVEVPIEAEQAGARYNVPVGQITRSLTFINGIESIANGEKWLTREGSDTEDDEALRARTLRAFADLAQRPIAKSFQNAAEAVDGVLVAQVDDHLPRGQGTFDIIVTSTAGEATEALLDDVRAAAEAIAGPYDNLLVKSSETVVQDLALTITIPSSASQEDAVTQTETALAQLLKLRKTRNLNELLHADMIFMVMSTATQVKNVKVTQPEQDLILGKDKVILMGTVTVTVERG